MGKPFLRGSVWYLDYTDEHGRRRKPATKCRTKREAEARQREIESIVDRRRFGLAPMTPNVEGLTLGALMQRHLDAMEPTTAQRVRGLVVRWCIEQDIGSMALERVAARDLEDVAALMDKAGLAPRTVNKLRTQVGAAFERARRLGWWVGENPARRIERRRVEAHRFDTLTEAEVQQLLAHLSTIHGEAGAWRVDMVALAVFLGLRRGELVALRAEWVDLAEGVLHIRASHARATTKTGKVREAPLFDDVRPFAARAFERVGGTGLLFPSPRGGGRLGRDLHCSAWVQRALVDLGIEKRMRFHDLRHTAATLMLEAGMDPHAVADILGHDMRVLESTYSHLGRRYRAREIQKMNKRGVA